MATSISPKPVKTSAQALYIDPDAASAILAPATTAFPPQSLPTSPTTQSRLLDRTTDIVSTPDLSSSLTSPPTTRTSGALLPSTHTQPRSKYLSKGLDGSSQKLITDDVTGESSSNVAVGADFLVLIARQERRVMELRAELAAAEQQLCHMKRNWSSQESEQRKGETSRSLSLRPLSFSANGNPWADGEPSMEVVNDVTRRRAATGHARSSSRRIFQPSRHARALSLVPHSQQPFTIPQQLDGQTEQQRGTPATEQQPRNPAESPIVSRPQTKALSIKDDRKDVLMAQSKQFAANFKDGLWTFIEDLKQAAVGDEARQSPVHTVTQPTAVHDDVGEDPAGCRDSQVLRAHTASNVSSTAIASPPDKSFWEEFEVTEQRPKAISNAVEPTYKTPQKVVLRTRLVDGESWDMWDSPDRGPASNSSASGSPSNSISSTANGSPESRASSDDGETERQVSASVGKTSVENAGWPAFSKHAGQLRRTASHLMNEWDRTMNSPESKYSDMVLRQGSVI